MHLKAIELDFFPSFSFYFCTVLHNLPTSSSSQSPLSKNASQSLLSFPFTLLSSKLLFSFSFWIKVCTSSLPSELVQPPWMHSHRLFSATLNVSLLYKWTQLNKGGNVAVFCSSIHLLVFIYLCSFSSIICSESVFYLEVTSMRGPDLISM